jgi:penicillin amidase
MRRRISSTQQEVILSVLKGSMTPEAGAEQLGISKRAIGALKQRYLKSKLPDPGGEVHAPLDGPVHVARDKWGIVHISANAIADCYVALGYAMAQDRLWHLDFHRRQAQGRLSEILGPGHLNADRLHRTVGLARSAETTELSDEAEMVLNAMSDGINAWMETNHPLPLEFDLLGYEPEPWSPADSISVWKWRWWMLTGRLNNIAVSEAARRHLPPDLFEMFMSIEACEETIVPGEGEAEVGGFDTVEGSNNWAVGSSRSATGKPILASDPHNPVWHPSQWYQAQLTAPGMDAIGAIFTGTPGIYIGHTRNTAWGVTNHTASMRDLYVESVPQDNPEVYREAGDWRPFDIEEEEIKVRGQAPEILTVRSTVRGPVVNAFIAPVDDLETPPLSLKWVGSEPFSGFESMLALHRSQSVSDVLRALEHWPCPALNMVFADSTGRIGYHAVGHIPKRPVTWHGFRPADDAAHIWDGYFPFEEQPHLVDPEADWVATANNPPWGGRGPYMSLGNWSDGFRYRRIRERIQSKQTHTPEEVGAIQADVSHGRAIELAPIVAEFARGGRSRRIRELGDLLAAWDGAYDTDSVAPTIFTAFWERWLVRVSSERFPERVVPLVSGRAGGAARRILLGDDVNWFPNTQDIGKVVRQTLSDALDWLREKLGPRRSQWRWGRVHRVRFAHPASSSEALEALLDLGPYETSGGNGTVRAAGYGLGRPFEVTGLSSYRMVVDLGDPARSWSVTTGGQSGHPASAHYGDHTALWLADAFHPLLMDPSDIQDNLEAELNLIPIKE